LPFELLLNDGKYPELEPESACSSGHLSSFGRMQIQAKNFQSGQVSHGLASDVSTHN